MLGNAQLNSFLIYVKNGIGKILRYLKNVFSDYIWKLEKITLLENQPSLAHKQYIASFRIKGNAEIVTVNFNQMDTEILNAINPLDAYICGIVYGLQTHKMYISDLDFLLNYFEPSYHYHVGCEVLSFKGVDLMHEDQLILSTMFINKTRLLPFEDIAKNSLIILGLPSNQAFQVGLTSFTLWVNKHNA